MTASHRGCVKTQGCPLSQKKAFASRSAAMRDKAPDQPFRDPVNGRIQIRNAFSHSLHPLQTFEGGQILTA